MSLRFTTAMVRRAHPWGNFPKRMRRYFLSQDGLCPYCPRPLAVVPISSNSAATFDHVVPKALGGALLARNKVLCHAGCNRRKADRSPYGCELLFCAITHTIKESHE